MIDVINPATGEVIGAIPDSAPADIDRAVAAAAKAFAAWSALAPAQRAAPMHKLADLIPVSYTHLTLPTIYSV